METFLDILVLISLVGISQVVHHLLPIIPVPLVQIALGIIVVLLPGHMHVPLEPELFFVLFIAPLLFQDGQRTPREELWSLKGPILLLAIGLVFATVLVGGYTIHALIPTIPLAAAFGLAAILSPTDVVAVGAIASRIHLPKKIHRLLEGEGLMNDASGLVAFKFAIAAAVTGVFSIQEASVSFVIVSVGGLIFGAFLSLVFIWFRSLLRRFGMEDVTVHMLIQILTPFVLFLMAEHAGLSGILAAVAGGIVHAVEQDRTRSSSLELKVVSESTWSVILFILNGLVFVILGLQIPDIVQHIIDDSMYSIIKALGYVVVIYVLLIVLRFLWLYVFGHLSWMRRNKETKPTTWTPLLLLSVSGVRGAVTLAGAFTIPLFLDSGAPFPERNLIIFLAAGVILLSLVMASITLPLLIAKESPQPDTSSDDKETTAESRSIAAALGAVRQAQNDDSIAASIVIHAYELRLAGLMNENSEVRINGRERQQELALRRLGIEKEKQLVEQLLQEGSIRAEDASRMQTNLKRAKLALTSPLHLWYILFSILFSKLAATLIPAKRAAFTPLSADHKKEMIRIKIKSLEAAVEGIHKTTLESPDATATAARVIKRYNYIIAMLRDQLSSDPEKQRLNEQVKELEMIAIQAERDEIQSLFQQRLLTRQQYNKLQLMISIREADSIEEGMAVLSN
ncbi:MULTISPECIES: Na+/H+ antiporter [unclassified Paenibacillus]|uniref:Na+/H+ antiporter n=1 Tax=unclassified Paenibacillus TaxID=185978 RepID=UPI0036316D5C